MHKISCNHSCGRRQVHEDLLRSNTFLCHLLRHARQDGVSVDGPFEDGLRGVVWGAAEIWDDTHRYGASLGGPLCISSKMYVRWVRLTSHKSETAQKAQTAWQTTSPWCWSRSSPPAAWIWWTHATWGVGGLAHVRSKAAVEAFNRFNTLK